MHHWTKGIMGDDPAYLAVGTEVSAKYKGAFCEAKVRKVVRSVKCKVTFKFGLGSAVVTDDQVRGTLRVGSVCEVRHPEKKEFVEATINKITDSSQYTVVFDDGDITTLRRTALCLKSGRHFAVSETLDQLPLTHPEHFSNPVIGGRKGRRSRQAHEDTSDEEDTSRRGSKKKEEKEADIGRVVCVELGDKKKQKDNWFPGLVVAPTAQDAVRIRVKDEYLVRSFGDGKYYTVPKREATEFTREIGSKVDNNSLKTAVEKALLFLDRDELPPHWDRDVLFGTDESSAISDSDGGLDSDSSDDEPREEKDHFVAQLYKFMDDRGTPINNEPAIGNKDIDLYKLFKVVHKLGGYNRVTNQNQWKTIARKVGFDQSGPSIKNLVKQAYKKFLHSFEEFYRKLGCTMVNHPRHSRPRHHGGRSLIRDRDRATPVNTPKEKAGSSTTDSIPESHDLPEKRDNVITPVAETSKSKVEESKLTVKEVKIEEKASTAKDKSIAKEECPSTEKVKKEKDVRKEKDVKKDAKKETLKREKESKKEKILEVKLRVSDASKELIKSAAIKEPETKEDDSKMKPGDKEVDEEQVTKGSLSARKDVKPKDDKGKKLRVQRQYGRQKKEDEVRVAVEEKAVPKVKEERVEEVARVKEEEKEESAKISEDEKSDDSKKMPDRREEAQTRSKSREDLKPDLALTQRRCSRDFDKPITPRPKKPEDDEEAKKRGRKRKDTDSKNPDDISGQLGVGIGVGVGDKLKVYYGPTHESKVYEAKVIEVEKETFLVHYTGWNTRYDEWIKRSRIAENLSWTPSRAKRLKLQQAKASAKTAAAAQPSLGKRGRPSTTGRESVGNQRARSTTPSSVTSSSSRTKSPGTPAPRQPRPPTGREYRRRTRRTSGHTDVSVASEASASESDEYTSEAEVEPTRTRSRSERTGLDKEELSGKVEVKEEAKRSSLRRKITPRKEEVEVEAEVEDDTGEDSGELSTGTDAVSDAQVVEKRRSTRTRKLLPTPERRDEGKREAGGESDEEVLQPKGRDFDLNQIRSELKGIEKAVKPPQEVAPAVEEKDQPLILDDKTGLIDSCPEPEKEAVAKTTEAAGKVTVSSTSSTDDIYEFKEPEPFEFEVRAKRDPLLPEERAKSSRKAGVKVADPDVKVADPDVKSPIVEKTPPKTEKTPPSRKKSVRNATAKSETKETPVVVEVDGAPKKRFRRTLVKKVEVAETTSEPEMKQVEVADPVTPQKTPPTSACEDAFNKLCESPVFRPAIPRRTPSPGHESEPLSLFGELPGEGKEEGEEDIEEDRLVISETDDCEAESQEPLFTYSQRHHEELLPTLVAEIDATIPPPLNLVEKPGALLQTPLTVTPASILASFHKTVVEQTSAKSTIGKSGTKCASPKRGGVKSPSMKCPSPRVNSPNPGIKSPSSSLSLGIKSVSPSVSSPSIKSLNVASIPTGSSSAVKSPIPVKKDQMQQERILESPKVKQDQSSQEKVPTKKDVPLLPKAKEELAVAPVKVSSSRPITDDVITALLLKESGEEFEEDPISAAIQRVISQSIAKEDTSDKSTLVKPKPVEQPAESKTTKSDVEVTATLDQQKRESLKRKSGGRKPVLSQEFVDDSEDSDSSSDAGSHLVIDQVYDDSASQQDGELSPVELPSKLVLDKARPLDPVVSIVEEKKLIVKEDSVQVVQDSGKVQLGYAGKAGRRIAEKKPRLEDVKEPATCISRTEEPIRHSPVTKEVHKPVTETKPTLKSSTAFSIQPPTVELKPSIHPAETEDTKEDLENNLSLLCEETIPGSPTPAQDTTEKDEVPREKSPETKSLFLEMPFASAPGTSVASSVPCLKPTGPLSLVSAEAMEAAMKALPKAPLVGVSPGSSSRKVDEAAAVLENTPPTTPSSSMSITSNSPREERVGMSPTLDIESYKSRGGSFEDSSADHKMEHFSEEDSLLNIEVSNSSDRRLHDMKLVSKKLAAELDRSSSSSPKKRQPRSRKRSECEVVKRLKLSSSTRGLRAVSRGASDSDDDDTSENSATGCAPLTSSENILLLASRSPRPSRYNFYVELDPELDGSQRIALLQQKLQELRKTYLTVKSELAGIDRRRKKLRRREREEKATKQEVACS